MTKKMMPIVFFVFVVSAMADQSPVYSNGEEQLFPVVHPNCTQSLTELLLLRQEIQLTKMAAAEEATTRLLQETIKTLTQVRDSLSEISGKMQGPTDANETHCDAPFVPVGNRCLLLALNELNTWASGRQFCIGRGADLAHFTDANDFVAILKYVNSINFARKKTCVFIGGSDEAVEDTWVWVTGELMPRGPPFWGTTDGYNLEPGQGRAENCAGLWPYDYYYLHDLSCGNKCAPLCQK